MNTKGLASSWLVSFRFKGGLRREQNAPSGLWCAVPHCVCNTAPFDCFQVVGGRWPVCLHRYVFKRWEFVCVHVCIYLKIPFFYKSIQAFHVVQFGFVFHFSWADITRITQKDTLFFSCLILFTCNIVLVLLSSRNERFLKATTTEVQIRELAWELFWRLGQESRIRVNPITNMFGKLKKKIQKFWSLTQL